MPRSILSAAAAIRGLATLGDKLGRADHERVNKLPPLIGDDRYIPLGTALTELYPDQPREAALTALRQMRGRLTAAAQKAGIEFALEADTRTRSPPEQRSCWFAGEDQAAEITARLGAAETTGDVWIRPDAVEIGKRRVRYFISYAHDDQALKDALMKHLLHWFGSANGYRFDPWQDRDILVGQDWHAEIQAAIQTCDFGLLLVSSAFLSSGYITREELRHFVAPDPLAPPPDKVAMPVALRVLRFDGSTDMKGLESRQLFRDQSHKAFQERTTDKTQHDFASELFGQIVRRLDAHFAAGATKPPSREAFHWQRETLGHDLEDAHHVPAHAQRFTLDKLETDLLTEQRREALDLLDEWARDETGPPCCALLGETGMGKTTTSKAFTHHLLDAREADKSVPLPIYLDLRLLGEDAASLPNLDTVINTVLRRSWQGGRTEPPPNAGEVRRLVREEGAIIIFDGLDEVLVHLSQRAGQQFTRELLSVLPPALWPRRRAPGAKGRPGRILLTCRTHYFRSVRDQNTHLTAEDRDDVRDTDYRVFMLLPFTDEQIHAYLTASLPGADIDRVLATIHSVHNLPELAKRPYTLSLITRHLPQIERWKLENRRVTGVDLYRHMVLSWLERDAGKHELEADHKQQIMEHVAARLWRSGGRTWRARQMEDWLAEFLQTTPSVARHYQRKDLEVLKKDLRTATFLVGGGRADFRFAHTSLQEFFLAAFLLRALREGRIEDWDMTEPSRETLDFLGQMLVGEDDDTALATLRAMRGSYRPRISELAFGFVLFALAAEYPAPSPAGFVLDGADLREWVIEGPADGAPLNLRGASFRGARLGNAVFRRIDLDGADFSGADLFRVELNRGRARGARFAGAALAGTVFRDIDLTDTTFADASPYRTQFLRCVMPEQPGLVMVPPRTLMALCRPAEYNVIVSQQKSRLASLGGHDGGVEACAFSPDGATIASAAGDQTIRLWDAKSGECRAVLRGHDNAVTACAFAPDGATIASAAGDQTIRLWDAKSGECRAILHGHDNAVMACAFAPDGATIASAAHDKTIRLWDAKSGECRAILRGHDNAVTACAFAPDGATIASAAHDKTIRLWDAKSGECRAILRGHDNGVIACAFSPDGATIASAADDQTIRLWDAKSGECRAILHGHDNAVMACAFSPDGATIASAAGDKTIRLWDAKSGECRAILRGHDNAVTACAFAPDGATIASAAGDQTIRLWDAKSGECRAILRGHDNAVTACAFAPDGATIASAAGDQTIRLWDAKSGECRAVLRGHDNAVTACAFSPDGATIASAAGDQTIRLWDAKSGECRAILRGHDNAVTACAFSPDGATIASAAGDQTIRLWDAKSGECRAVLRGHDNAVMACAFSPDGATIASAAGDQTIRLWDAKSGECRAILRGHDNGVIACAFAPDGATIASAAGDQTIRLWDAKSGECRAILHGHDNAVMACAFSPDGATIASAAHDKTIRLWDAKSGECRAILRGHDNGVIACAFSPDGATIASAADDQTIRLWDAKSRQQSGFRVHMLGDSEFASVTSDGKRVIQVSTGAWRNLGWLVPDDSGALTRYPAEVFGPLPEMPAERVPADREGTV